KNAPMSRSASTISERRAWCILAAAQALEPRAPFFGRLFSIGRRGIRPWPKVRGWDKLKERIMRRLPDRFFVVGKQVDQFLLDVHALAARHACGGRANFRAVVFQLLLERLGIKTC